MKRLFGMLLLVTGCSAARAQTFDEWFRQKKTQLKYLEQQIAALRVYIQATEQGYRIAKQGTQQITSLKQEDFDLHSVYFSSLTTVKPAIRQYPKVSAILTFSSQILAVAGAARQLAEALPSRMPTIAAFYDGLLEDCSEDIDWTKTLTTDGQAQLTDDERITAIDKVYERMKQRLEDAIVVGNEIGQFTVK